MTSRTVATPTWADLERAWAVVHATLPPTPLLDETGTGPALKLESLQPTGSFKVRGALAALSDLDPDTAVVTASAGNHGLGVAWAARRLGRRATIVTATTASPAKVAALRDLGVDLVQVGTSYDDAEQHALRLASDGGHFVSAYNDTAVIAGQASIGFELATQTPGPVTVVCGVGGGGLASGLGLWASRQPGTRVVGVEAAASRAMSAAVSAGRQVTVHVGDTLADGMAGNIEPGAVTVDLVARHVDDLVAVTEEQLRHAVRHLALDRGVVAEGSGAAAVAAVLAGLVPTTNPVVAVVSGRNITARELGDILHGSA
ncbi:serine/threonine dehydratase [Asanoa ishikariensis]|uniref:Threonine dehydratase n=1 Tax=Asanoa ishikariensis TaxID=137265 RepID=A0A1H3SZB5_9ACTN|nr:pyridoxal-phosphate dependent enzyme [Asanoa ishikariensis]GIF63276.1 serine/threonine dehydratase [Asanoa ishikariensis]SDZ42845.1 threonine dehydratase [Asanoa ishikariensis]